MKRSTTFALLALCFTYCFFIQPVSCRRIRFNQEALFDLRELTTLADDPDLKVHMIAHSHDDLGWLATVDEYYSGSVRPESVKAILDSTIPALVNDPTKKFIYVEMGFFKRWWDEQDNATKDSVRQLVKNGQLEFISGGYAMNDEADVYYEDAIEQMSLGHKFLLDTFGVKPEIAWQIDPFGHASTQAALFAQMGFKAFFVGRIDYQDKAKRLEDQTMEMVWIPQTSQGVENAILTHVNFYHYLDPKGFCFDKLCSDSPVPSDENGLRQRADQFVNWFREMKRSYKAQDLIHTAGTDFSYMNANENFGNYQKLFSYVNNHPEYKVKFEFSTPSQYLKAIYPLNLNYAVKTDDFFPYADQPNAYWTGYFTSRVAIKALVRESGRFLQASKRLVTQLLWEKASKLVHDNFKDVNNALDTLEEALAIAQHHDAVAGTEMQAVAEDYKMRLTNGLDAVNQAFLYPAVTELIQRDLGLNNIQLSSCRLNTSATSCEVTFKNLNTDTPVLVAVYNSGPEKTSTIRVKVPTAFVQVKSVEGKALPTDVICSGNQEAADCDLFFSSFFKGYDIGYYYLVPSKTSNEVEPTDLAANQPYQINSAQSISLADNDMTQYELKHCKIENLQDCHSTKFNLLYNYYQSYQGWGQVSGAYIFRSNGESQQYDRPVSGKVYKGKNLLQISLKGQKTATNMRIYGDAAKGVEINSFVDSIPVDDGQGKEIIMLVEVPSIQNGGTFYTDSMGMEMQKRVIDTRPTWNLEVTEPVAGNYYPVQSAISILDENSKESLAVVPDRAQGGSSLKQGQIELMIHRRLLQDDARGVMEPLNEYDEDNQGLRQWVTHVLVFNKPGYIQTPFREIQTNIDMPNLVLLSGTKATPNVQSNLIRKETAGIADNDWFKDLSENVKWMARPLSPTKFLFRFQNMRETETHIVSTNVFNSATMGKGKPVEMSLTANQPKTEMVKNKYNWNGLPLNKEEYAKTDYLNEEAFTLRPLEIRTFMVTFNKLLQE